MVKYGIVQMQADNVRYQQLHDIIFEWVEPDGDIPFKGLKSRHQFTDLDIWILTVFGYEKYHSSYPSCANQLNRDIDQGRLNLNWIRDKHGLTLFKAKLCRGLDGDGQD